MPTRLQFSIDARKNIFNSTLPEESILSEVPVIQIPE